MISSPPSVWNKTSTLSATVIASLSVTDVDPFVAATVNSLFVEIAVFPSASAKDNVLVSLTVTTSPTAIVPELPSNTC